MVVGVLDPARAKPKTFKTPKRLATDPAKVNPQAIETRFRQHPGVGRSRSATEPLCGARESAVVLADTKDLVQNRRSGT